MAQEYTYKRRVGRPRKRGKSGKRRYNLTARVRSALRKLWYYSPYRYQALKASLREKGLHECAICHGMFPDKQFVIDHIVNVTPPYEHFTWDEYIYRLFVHPSGLQTLCKPCHTAKTNQENKDRRNTKGATFLDTVLGVRELGESEDGSNGDFVGYMPLSNKERTPKCGNGKTVSGDAARGNESVDAEPKRARAASDKCGGDAA